VIDHARSSGSSPIVRGSVASSGGRKPTHQPNPAPPLLRRSVAAYRRPHRSA
jgi:hypothetical protein